jgi:hypothetical protein
VQKLFLFRHFSPHSSTAVVGLNFLKLTFPDHVQLYTLQSVGLAWTKDRPAAWPVHNTHKRRTAMLPERFETTIPETELRQTLALDRSATGIGVQMT